MAFTGSVLHVSCGFCDILDGNSKQGLLSAPIWSETLNAAGKTINSAPTGAGTRPVFRIRSAVDAWVAIGPNPDSVSGTRLLVAANQDYDFYGQSGDKLDWSPV